MKTTLNLIFRLVTGLLLLLLFSCSSDNGQLKNSEPAFAKVIQLKGTVQRLFVKGDAVALKLGDLLETGAKIETAVASSLTLQFADESKLLVAENSSITMDALQRSGKTGEVETVIRMDAGSAESRVAKQSGGFKARYRVVTPAMQLAVRGTIFVVKVDENSGRSSSMVIEGTVIASAEGKDIELGAGFGTVTDVGQPPQQPTELLPPPTFGTSATPRPGQLVWNQVDNAGEYRVQVLGGASNDSLVHDQIYTGNEISFINLPDGTYLLKVSGIDKQGLEGQTAEQAMILDVHPFSPLPKSPLNGAIVKRKKTRFIWERSSEAKSYLLQVADSADFSNIVSQVENLPSMIGRISIKLPSGGYHWRIAAVSSDKEQGPFAAAHEFTVVRR